MPLTRLSAYYRLHRYIRFLSRLLICISLGLVWYLLLYGSAPLRLANVGWAYSAGGDTFQHQLGWEWFRQEPWRFPLGRIEAYGYPFGTSLSFMDSIPLFAVPFKILSPLMPEPCQFLGLWELTSLIGQLFFGLLILGEFTQSSLKKLLGATLLMLSPVLIFRAFGQSSLSAHWIVLAGIWFILLEYKHKLWRGSWVLLFAITMLVHLYFVAMLVPLWLISLIFLFKWQKSSRAVTLELLVVIVLLLVEGYCLGLFNLSLDNLEGWGYGVYSWNLNGFLNPFQSSAFFKQLPVGSYTQNAGYSYLGLGNLILIPVALVLFFRNEIVAHRLRFLLPFMLVSLFYILFSLSNKGFINDHALWDIQLPNYLLHLSALFRSSGRFIWPVFYFIVLFGLVCIIRNSRFAMSVLILALVIQLVDIQPLYSAKKDAGMMDYQSSLQSEFWQAAARENKHIVFIPTNYKMKTIYQPFALYARKNNITLNWGYFARADYPSIDQYADQAWKELISNKSDYQTLYLFWDASWETKIENALADNMVICKVDGYNVILSEKNSLTQTNPAILKYCSFPQNFDFNKTLSSSTDPITLE